MPRLARPRHGGVYATRGSHCLGDEGPRIPDLDVRSVEVNMAPKRAVVRTLERIESLSRETQ